MCEVSDTILKSDSGILPESNFYMSSTDLEQALSETTVSGSFTLPVGYVLDSLIENKSFGKVSIKSGSFSCGTFNKCNFEDVTFENVVLDFVTFKDCSIEKLILIDCTFNGMKLVNSNAKNIEFVQKKSEGINTTNAH